MTNPLLTAVDLPSYAAIQPEHVEPAIDLSSRQPHGH